jgi:aldehyde dehydrogenase (NAD+)
VSIPFASACSIAHRRGSISWNHGQTCCAGSRIYVQEGIYDEFVSRFTAKTKELKLGDPFASDSYQGPQVSQVQFDVRLSIRLSDALVILMNLCLTAHHGAHRCGQERRRDGAPWR